MMKKKVKSITLMLLALMSLLPDGVAHAYTSPYYIRSLGTPYNYGGQASQIVAKNNSIYVSSFGSCAITRVKGTGPDYVTGKSFCGGTSGIEGPPSSIDVGSDGTIYVAEPSAHLVRGILPDGTFRTIAGNGTSVDEPYLTDATDATQTPFSQPSYVKMGPDNILYVFDSGVVRRILPDGSTDHYVGDFNSYDNNNPYVDGAIANQHYFPAPATPPLNGGSSCLFDFDKNGNMYLATGSKVYKVNHSDATIHIIHDDPISPVGTYEDQPLSTAGFGSLTGFAVDSDGQLWNGGQGYNIGYSIRHVSLDDQIVRTAAGGGSTLSPPLLSDDSQAPIKGQDLSLYSVWSISADNGVIYYLGYRSNSSGGATPYVGQISLTQDYTPPQINAQTNVQSSGGWYSSPVDVTWSVSDAQSLVSSTNGCSPQHINATSSTTLTCTATSLGGTTSQSITLKVDTTAPILTLHSSPTPNTNGWVNTVENLSWDISEPDSPIFFQFDCGPYVVDYDADQMHTCSVTSGGGTSTSSYEIRVDRTAPSVSAPTVTGGVALPLIGTVLLSGSTTISTNVADNLSGVQKAEYYLDSDPGQGNGTALSVSGSTASASATIPTGQHTIYARSLDNAGNWSAPASLAVDRLI